MVPFESLLTAFILGYFLGSIPFGLVLCRLFKIGDIRKIGSGNIGVTNVLRTGRKGVALLTLVCDVSKAGVASLIVLALTHSPLLGLFTGASAVFGHNFPVWLKFKGGKGVAATLGVILVNSPLAGLYTLGTWLLVALIFRYSSLAALVSLLLAPLYAFLTGKGLIYILFYLFLAGLAYVRHIQNIKRLLNKTESKIKLKRISQK